MGFCGADFEVSKVPVAPVALQVAAKKVVNAAAKKTQVIRDFAAELKQQLETEIGPGWHVLVGADFSVDLRYRKDACVLLSSKRGAMKVLLYRTTPAVGPAPTQEHEVLAKDANRATAKRKTVVFECDMPGEMQEVVVDKAKRLYAHWETAADRDEQLARALKHSLTVAYGATWQVVVSSSRELCCLPEADAGTHADFSLAKTRVVVYRHAGDSLDRKLDASLLAKRVAFVLATICLMVYGFLSIGSADELARCRSRGRAAVGEDGITPLTDSILPEGCSAEDVERANSQAWWKATAIFGLAGFMMLASLLRMYGKTLSQKTKRT